MKTTTTTTTTKTTKTTKTMETIVKLSAVIVVFQILLSVTQISLVTGSVIKASQQQQHHQQQHHQHQQQQHHHQQQQQQEQQLEQSNQEANFSDKHLRQESKTGSKSRLKPDQQLEQCPSKSPLLLGPLRVIDQFPESALEPGTEEFVRWFGDRLKSGGTFKPDDCVSKQKVAIIVPYRDRSSHLKIFLHHLHPILQRQQLEYRLVVVEQTGFERFNRGTLMNVGFVEASKLGDFDCFVFHDVDLLPEDDRNLYECPLDNPKHMSVAINKWGYRLQYNNYFGGVTAISRDQFSKMNGYANTFYGWGGEDDDLHHRIQQLNLTIYRSSVTVSRFFMQLHGPTTKNDDLETLMVQSANNELANDGLSTLKYKIVQQKEFPLYTWILVEVPKGPGPHQTDLKTSLTKEIWGGFGMLGNILKSSSSLLNPRDSSDRHSETRNIY